MTELPREPPVLRRLPVPPGVQVAPDRPAPLFREFVGAACARGAREVGRADEAAATLAGLSASLECASIAVSSARPSAAAAQLHATFEALCRIQSPTGRERAVADWSPAS